MPIPELVPGKFPMPSPPIAWSGSKTASQTKRIKMTCQKIGKHNDRFIFIEEVENLRHIETNYSSESAILLWLGNEDWKKEEFIDVVEKMVKKEVIAICVTGTRVDEQFDLLISTQGPISTK
jgi:nitrogen regulatory protein PII